MGTQMMLGILIRAKDQASAVMGKVDKSFKGMSGSADNAAARFNKAAGLFKGGLIAFGAGAGIALALGTTVKAAADMETAMVGVRKTTGMAGTELAALKDDFLKLSTKIPVAAIELADIGAVAGQMGIRGKKNILEFTRAVADMSVATEFSAEEGALALSKLANQFSLPITQAKNMGSVLNELSNNAEINSVQVADITDRLSSAGTAMGMTMPEVAALGSSLVAMGLSTETTGTALSNTMMGMLRDTEKFAKVAGVSTSDFKRMIEKDALGAVTKFAEGLKGMSSFDASQALEDVGLSGSRAGAVLLKLATATTSQNGEQSKLVKLLGIANAGYKDGTSMQKEAKDAADTFEGQLQILKNTVFDLKEGIGKELLPMLTNFVKKAGETATKVSDWAKDHESLVRTIVIVAAALSGLLMVGGLLVMLVAGLTMAVIGLQIALAVLTWPIVLIALGIAALIAIGIALIANWDWVKAKALEIWNGIKENVVLVAQLIALIWQTTGQMIISAIEAAGNAVEAVFTWVEGLATRVTTFIANAWTAMGTVITGVWEGVKTSILSSISTIIEKINSAITSVNKISGKIGIKIPMIPSIGGKGGGGKNYATGFEVARDGFIPGAVHEGEVLIDSESTRAIKGFADLVNRNMSAGGGAAQATTMAASGGSSIDVQPGAVVISFPSVTSVSEIDANDLMTRIENALLDKARKNQESTFRGEFAPSLG